VTGLELVADCSQCAGLCCVLLPFRAEDGFGRDKPGGEACGNLDAAHLCRIHDRLAESGWSGCVRYDCQGAGQHVTQTTYAGQDWRASEVNLAEMAAVFSVMRVLHAHLAELDPSTSAYAETAALTTGTADQLLELDLSQLPGS
jgi:hypothetical protein